MGGAITKNGYKQSYVTALTFKKMVDEGLFSRAQLYAEIPEIVAGKKAAREHANERILIHTTGLVSQDVAIAHWVFEQAKAAGFGIVLPAAR